MFKTSILRSSTKNFSILPASEALDRNVLGGAALAFGLIAFGVLIGGQWLNFLNPASMLIVLGGTLGATMIHFSSYDLRSAWNAFKNVMRSEEPQSIERIDSLVRMAHLVRQNGLLVLEREARTTGDPFLRMALELTVDGQKPEEVRRILETEMATARDRGERAVQVFETMGQYAPAMGLIGTLIGLIQMLGALDNPQTVGPAMAVALVTTLYGALLANLFFLPVAGKLRNRLQAEALVKAISVEGAISLGQQENPIVLEQRLQSFMPLNSFNN
ncbi:MAG: motility protein A [Candidatus Dadabacteria bacterium]|nr:MAG: motility protein A [Candidatus Dadabacteria bacterium]